MDPDRHFAQMLDQLREAHESLRLEHGRKVAALEGQVAQLQQEKQGKALAIMDLHEIAVEESSPALGGSSAASAAKSNTVAPSPTPTSVVPSAIAKKQKRNSSAILNLNPEEESGTAKMWAKFDAATGGAIILYTLIMFIELHIHGVQNGKTLEHEPLPDFARVSVFVEVMNHMFNMIFLVEFLIRVYFLRLRYFYDERVLWFNLFDSSLVWLTVLEAYIFSAMSMNLAFIRVVRIVRLLRSLRVVRTLRFFVSLRILVATVAVSFMALFWSMVLLGVVMLMGALCLCQLLGSSITDKGLALGTRSWVNRYYGTPGRSLWTMFEMTFSGCWPNYARTLIEEVSALYVIFFVIYIAGVVFAMTRIITALFLKDTMAIASADSDAQIQTKMKEKQAYAKKLQTFFEEADTSGDGLISEAEFLEILDHPRARAYLASLEIDASESINLFRVIDDGDGKVSSEEFVRSALRLKGFARAQDLVILTHELHKMMKEMKDNMRGLQSDMLSDLHYKKQADRSDKDIPGLCCTSPRNSSRVAVLQL